MKSAGADAVADAGRAPRRPGAALLAAVVAGLLLVTTLAGCGGDAGADARPARTAGRVRVVVGFYPLEYVVAQVAGGRATVRDLTRPGAEAHDVELTPHDVAAVHDADLVVYLAGFQPAVDDAVTAEAGDRAFDVAAAARLDLAGGEASHVHAGGTATGRRLDPHFWLDPTRLADVTDAVAARLARSDPAGSATYLTNAATLRSRLRLLDTELRAGLASCRNRMLVTSHEAFAYLADRYDLRQVGIAGRSPDNEPDATTLARVADLVRTDGVSTIYYETLVSPAIARTVAAETGVRTAVLDPLEGITPSSAARDYLGVMRANLATLRDGQGCT